MIADRPTIIDVAERAGVSRGTVSRVLAGSPRVLPATRVRVLEAIEALDYQPSSIARSLRLQRTRTVGLIVTDITNPFYPEVVRGFEDTAQEIGLGVFLCNAAEDPRREARYLALLTERRVDAVVIAAGGLRHRQADALRSFRVPVVVVNASSPDPRIPAVLSDSRAGGRMAAQHLIELGHRQLVYVLGPREADETPVRLEGARDATRSARGLGVALEVVHGDGHLSGGTAAAHAVASRLKPPYALMCHNDMTAIGAMHGLTEAGIRVPDDVSVVGFDDIALTDYTVPPLTTVAQDKYAMGRRAVRLIDRILAGETVSGTERLPVRLVVRASTARPQSLTDTVTAPAPR
jgi:LacI family transcriptional regulator, galactose operon repressor